MSIVLSCNHNLEMLHSIYTEASHKDRQWIKLKSKWIHLLNRSGGMCTRCQESNPFVLEFHHREENRG